MNAAYSSAGKDVAKFGSITPTLWKNRQSVGVDEITLWNMANYEPFPITIIAIASTDGN